MKNYKLIILSILLSCCLVTSIQLAASANTQPNGNTMNDAITHTGVNPSVIESLGEMYLETELTTRLKQSPTFVEQ